MKSNRYNLIWGIALIAAGGLFLAQNLGYLGVFAPQFWVIFFGALSLLFFASYFASGIGRWGWLFPALGSAALALTIGLGSAGVRDAYVGAPILGAIAIPFLVAYALDPRRNGWALIPAWVMGVLCVVTVLADRVPGEFIGALVLFAIGLPFLVVFLADRKQNWWALIPASILLVLGAVPLLTMRVSGELLGAVIMFLFAAPFLLVFLWSRANWWALIPCGTFVSIGLTVLAVTASRPNEANPGLVSGVLFLGWALTFLALWLRRGLAPTAWAKYPGVVLAAMALVAFGFGENGLEVVWPLAIIALGAVLLYSALRRRSA
jgi:hypothetical protein